MTPHHTLAPTTDRTVPGAAPPPTNRDRLPGPRPDRQSSEVTPPAIGLCPPAPTPSLQDDTGVA